MDSIQPALTTDLFMERLRRSADSMSRDELLVVVHQLSHAYSVQRAASVWAANQAAENLTHGRTTGNHTAESDSPSDFL
jgi:hypothetical protein